MDSSLAVAARNERGKGPARRLRQAGRIPGVVYNHSAESTAISLDPEELDQLIKASHAGLNTLIALAGESDLVGRTVIVRELQRDPVRGSLLHADFYETDPNAKIVVHVPLHVVGIAAGVRVGGILDHALRELEVECLTRAIPDSIDVDVEALEVGDSIHVSDLSLPDGVELRTAADLPVVSIMAPVLEEEPGTEEEGEGLAEGATPAEDEAKPEGD